VAQFPRRRLRRLHDNAANTLGRADFLHQRLRDELLSRLDFIALKPSCVLDLGSGSGQALPRLQSRFPDATLVAVDHAPRMLAAVDTGGAGRLCGAAEQLPLSDQSIDLVFCNLTLAYCPDPVPVLAEIRRVLREPGLMLFSTFGPDTLAELRTAWADADNHTHVIRFPDMHDLGDLVVRAGLAEPVLDRDVLTVTYEYIQSLRDDLRAAGSVNRTAGRNPGLTGRESYRRFRAGLEQCRNAEGRLSLTGEVVFGQAWAGTPAAQLGGIEASFPADQIGRRRK
jgi:malonyl-CoA O-methyltransferase